MRLKDKVCLVTGASRGIGRAIAITFGREGADVAVNYSRSREKAEEVVNEIIKFGRKAITVKADVSNKEEVNEMVETVIKEFGKIDVLVNNAGITWRNPDILGATKEEWEKVLGVNLLGTYYCIQAVAPYMIKQRYGKIINIASLAGIGVSIGEEVAYAPSKAAVINLTKRLAYKLGPYNINVNAIAPGLIRTEILSVGRSKEEVEKLLEEVAKLTALRRTGEPQDIANVALFLASDESNFITGQLIVADGGRFNFLSHSV
ncbi:MAG: 3-oxoacyl-ACP reductase family protein [Nitrososphaeria archaeon]